MDAGSTREEIVRAADRLFHEGGYDHTAFSDIAAAVGISRGNFYYHFKAKDEILAAVIARRAADTRAMLARWEAAWTDPAARIRAFIHILLAHGDSILRHGCPVGTLCQELAKLGHAAQPAAAGIFTLFRDWLARHFALLGRAADADALALHLLARTQGVATLAVAFQDEGFLRAEVALMEAWLAEQAQGDSPPCS